jgi:hypothetical protein
MTASELKAKVEASGNESHFFTRATMRFFGDTMRNYGVRGPVEVETHSGVVKAYELYRRRPVKHNNVSSTYFNAETFSRVFPKR